MRGPLVCGGLIGPAREGPTARALADPTDRAFVRTVQAWEGLNVPAAVDQIARESEDLNVPISAGLIVLAREDPIGPVSTDRNVRLLVRSVPARTGLPALSVRKPSSVGARRARNSALVSSRRNDRHNEPGNKPVRGRNSAPDHSSNARERSNSGRVLGKEVGHGRTNTGGRKERGRHRRRNNRQSISEMS